MNIELMRSPFIVKRLVMQSHIFINLEALGNTEEKVVEALTKLKIRGHRNSPCACPIVEYLKSKDSTKLVTAVTGMCFQAGGQGGISVEMNGVYYRFPLSQYPELKGVRDFFWNFDRTMLGKRYTQLEKTQ